jgi:hypothetical protein
MTRLMIGLLLLLWLDAKIRAADATPPLPATVIENVPVPLPSEIFASLDKFPNSNWRAVQRPEIGTWKAHGDEAQLALVLGATIAEGFVAVEAQDAGEVEELGRAVLRLSRGLGVQEEAMRRSRSIVEHARAGDWVAVRLEWDGVLPDVESGMKALQSEQLSQLVSLGGWLRGTQALTALILQNYSSENAALLRQPILLDSFAKHLDAMSSTLQAKSIITSLKTRLRNVQPFIGGKDGAPSKTDVEETAKICAQLLERLKASR